jgi:Icc-related predicted phosphoesterase
MPITQNGNTRWLRCNTPEYDSGYENFQKIPRNDDKTFKNFKRRSSPKNSRGSFEETRNEGHAYKNFQRRSPPMNKRGSFVETRNEGSAYKNFHRRSPPMNKRGSFEETVSNNQLKMVFLSDTHSKIEKVVNYAEQIPKGDILIISGDFTNNGSVKQLEKFDEFMQTLPHPIKIVVAGNHEKTLENIDGLDTADKKSPQYRRLDSLRHSQRNAANLLKLKKHTSSNDITTECKSLLQNVVYLEDQEVNICGISFYGTPWVRLSETSKNLAFSLPRGEELEKKWSQIPDHTDVLITHMPPYGYGDSPSYAAKPGDKEGDKHLLDAVVKRVKPKIHVFGHNHFGYGTYKSEKNENTLFINASTCDENCKPINKPIVKVMTLPPGYTRKDFGEITMAGLRQQINGINNGSSVLMTNKRAAEDFLPIWIKQQCQQQSGNNTVKTPANKTNTINDEDRCAERESDIVRQMNELWREREQNKPDFWWDASPENIGNKNRFEVCAF